jgi:hypothetical protein
MDASESLRANSAVLTMKQTYSQFSLLMVHAGLSTTTHHALASTTNAATEKHGSVATNCKSSSPVHDLRLTILQSRLPGRNMLLGRLRRFPVRTQLEWQMRLSE